MGNRKAPLVTVASGSAWQQIGPLCRAADLLLLRLAHLFATELPADDETHDSERPSSSTRGTRRPLAAPEDWERKGYS
jgi:hypothetical protein